MTDVQLPELKALPKASNETSITIPAENSYTTNNNGRFKIISSVILVNSVEISGSGQNDEENFKISICDQVVLFIHIVMLCLLSVFWFFLESLLDSFSELIKFTEMISHNFFCNIPLTFKICFNKPTQNLPTWHWVGIGNTMALDSKKGFHKNRNNKNREDWEFFHF